MIKIVTDTTSSLSKEYLDRYGITAAPSYLFFENERFQEGVDLSYPDFCSKLKSVKSLPTTAAASSAEFVSIYSQLAKEAETIFSIHISSNLSLIYRNATIGAEMVSKDKSVEVKVIDSKVIDLGLGMIVLEAAKAAQMGKSKEEIEKLIAEIVGKVKCYFYVDTMEFLMKSTRVTKLRGIFAGILNMKPILAIENGEMVSKDKAIGKEKALEKILMLMGGEIKPQQSIRVAVSDVLAKAEGDNLLKMIKEKFDCKETLRSNLSTSVAVHCGPGTVAVSFYPALAEGLIT